MLNDTTALLAIALIALVTWGTRIIGPLLMRRISMSPRIERFLEGLSVSVIAALVASILAQNGWREALSVAVAGAVMFLSKSAIGAMLAGMVCAALWLMFF